MADGVTVATNTTLNSGEAAFLAAFPHVQAAVQQFSAVRYVAVACLTMALLDRVLACPRETCKLYRSPLSTVKVLYFANRYINLCCLGIDVFLYTQWLFSDNDTCIWWFSFRAWAGVIVVTVIEALLILRLYLMYEKKKVIAFGFGIFVLAQLLATCIMMKHSLQRVSAVPHPGYWFSGCFPVFDCAFMWSVWITSMAIKVTICLAALLATILTWSTSRGQKSLWRVSEENGIRFFLGIAGASIFVTVWWMKAPLPLVSISPTVASALYGLFGSRLVVNMSEYRCNIPPEPPVELRVIRPKAADIVSQDSGMDMSPHIDLEKGLRTTCMDLSPHSQASTLLGPDAKRDSAPGLQIVPGSMDTLIQEQVAHHDPSSPSSHANQPTLPTSPTHATPSFSETSAVKDEGVASSSRRPFSEDTPRSPPDSTVVAFDEDDELDRELAQEYDEEGRRRKPTRTHSRRWKSDEVVGRTLCPEPTIPRRVPSPLGPLGPVAGPSNSSSSRSCFPAASLSRIYPSQRPQHAHRPSSPLTPPSTTTTSTRPSFDRPSRNRLSQFLHRHRSETGSISVLEEDVSDAFSPQEGDGSPGSRLSRTSSHQAARLRRLLASSPPPSPSSIRTALNRRESDVITIGSASTAFQFDNTHVFDAPDFTN